MADLSEDNKLELMRLEAEHARVYGSRMEMAYVIAQRQAEIKRIQASIDAQDKRLLELNILVGKIKNGD